MSERTAVVISNPTVGAELGHLKPWLRDNGFDVRRLVRDDILSADAADMPIVLASARLTIALIPIALVWFMANPVARWMVAGLALVRLASAPWSMQSGDAAPAWPELAALACALIAVGLLVTRRASHWFATRGHLSDDAAS